MIDSSMSPNWMHSSVIARCTEKSLLLMQTAFLITSQVSDTLALLRYLILGAHGHKRWPSFFILLSSSIESSQTALTSLTFDSYLLDYSQVSERSVCNLKKTFRARGHLRWKECSFLSNWCVSLSFESTVLKVRKTFLVSSFQNSSLFPSCCVHIQCRILPLWSFVTLNTLL